MNDQHENDKTEERKDKEVGPRRPLLRSRDDRKIWGVAGGLAEHVGFNPTLVRVFFVVTSFFGGAGLLAYLVLAVALPEDDGTGQPVPESVWARLGKVVLVCVLVAVGLFVAAGLAVVSAWVTATGHGTVIAIAVIVFGLGLVAAAFAGDIRRRIVPLLVVAGLVLGIPAGAVAAADIHIDESIGQRTYTPTIAGRHPGRRLQARYRAAGRRPPPAALGEGPDDSGLGPPRDRADDRLGTAERLHRRRSARQGGRADLRRPGRSRGRPGHRPGLSAQRCAHR